MKTGFFTFLTTVVLISALAPASRAEQASLSLRELVSDYLALPQVKNEKRVEDLINNPFIMGYVANQSGESASLLEKLKVGSTERLILQKQYFLGKIYDQAVLEINGSQSADLLRALIFRGQIPSGAIDPLSTPKTLPTIER